MFPKRWWNSPPCPTLGPCPCPLVPHPGTPTATKLPSPPPERSPRGAAWPRMQGVARTQGRGTLRAAPSSASYPPYGKAGIWTTDTSSLYDRRSDYVRKNIVFLKIMIKYTFFKKGLDFEWDKGKKSGAHRKILKRSSSACMRELFPCHEDIRPFFLL